VGIAPAGDEEALGEPVGESEAEAVGDCEGAGAMVVGECDGGLALETGSD